MHRYLFSLLLLGFVTVASADERPGTYIQDGKLAEALEVLEL